MSEVKYVVDGYETMLNELKQENQKLQRRIDVFERAKRIWDRRSSGEYSDLNDASQEAAHYCWLDDQNKKLEDAVQVAVDCLEYFVARAEGRHPDGYIISLTTYGKFKEAISKIKSLGIVKEGE